MSLFETSRNPFESNTGSGRLIRPNIFVPVIAVIALMALLIKEKDSFGITICLSSFVLIFVLYWLFRTPKLGIFILLIMGFFVNGAGRYVPAAWGLTIDIVIVLTYISLFFKGFAHKIPWNKARSSLTVLVTLWMGYVFLQIGNPEVKSKEAWFYAMRGVALYQFLMIPLLFVLFDKAKDLNIFFIIWGILSLLGTLKGIQQFQFGVDPFEHLWLEAGGAETHILFGKLRIFSFYSDAGQFGASQAHAGVVFIILALFKKDSIKLKTFFIVVALAGFVGMFISGTRGAIAVPAMGGIVFLILKRNVTVLALGGVFGALVFIFFAYTTIGQGNAEIRRMRTAFDPNEASLQIRLANQNKLKGYLAARPFGGGLGATGNWGKRFTPHTFLANTATDSWYVMIWADTGIVGLVYYLFMIFFILFVGARNVMCKIRDDSFKIQMTALTCGMAGIMLASYGNGVFGQMPTGIIMYISMVWMFNSSKMEQLQQENSTQLH